MFINLLKPKINMKHIKYIGIVVLGLFITYSCYFFVEFIVFKIEIKKASNGDPKAQVQLGNIYRQGKLISKNYDKALEWYLKAAEQGYVGAQYNTGYLYDDVYQDYSKALEWFLKAAEQKFSGAQNSIGVIYLQGKGVAQDYSKALEWFLKAAEQDDGNAKYHLAVMYLEGLGVTKDYKKAYQLNITAAKLGIVNAEYNLGVTYLNGLGVPKNERIAFKWFDKSTKNCVECQYKVGLMYEFGTGIAKKKNIPKAKELYEKAAKHRHICAKHRLELLQKNN